MLAALLLAPQPAGRPAYRKYRRRWHTLDDGYQVLCTFKELGRYLLWLEDQAEYLRLRNHKRRLSFNLKKSKATFEYYCKKIGDYYEED